MKKMLWEKNGKSLRSYEETQLGKNKEEEEEQDEHMKNSKRIIIKTTITAATTKTTTTTRVFTNNDKNSNCLFLTPSQLRGSYLGDNSNKENGDYNRTRKKGQ